MSYSNIMNSDCEGCFFKLGHRCDLTDRECRNQQEYTPKPVYLKTANKLNDYCKECNYRKDDKCTASKYCKDNSLFTVDGDSEKQCIKCKHSCESIYSCKDCIDFSDYEPIKEENIMNNNIDEKYKLILGMFDNLTNAMNDIQKEMKELKKLEDNDNKKYIESINKDILADYFNLFNKFIEEQKTFWFLDKDSEIVEGDTDRYLINMEAYNPFAAYPCKEYAITSAKIKKFNDMLLAFKWCYDKVLTDFNKKEKYYIYYDTDDNCDNCYKWDSLYDWVETCIYFSNDEVAQKCCDWLNDIDPNGQLLK